MRAVLIVVALSAVARAEMPARVSVAGDGACPTAAATARALERLHPRLRIDGGVAVEVVDRGATYVVRAGERTRTLEDPARRCAERATAAALAATLLLDPPAPPPVTDEPSGPLAPRETPEPPSTPRASASSPVPPQATVPQATAPPQATVPPQTTVPPQAPVLPQATVPPQATATSAAPASPRPAPADTVRAAAASRPHRPSRIDLELVGLVDGAPALATAASEMSGGASLRLAIGGRYLAATLGFTGLAPTTATSAGIAVDVVRIPFDAGLRLVVPAGRVEPGADVGLTLAILRLSAPALAGAADNTRLDVGARVAPFLRILLTSRLALVIDAQMIVSFAPYDLVVNGAGTIATTPRLWIGGGLGLAARL